MYPGCLCVQVLPLIDDGIARVRELPYTLVLPARLIALPVGGAATARRAAATAAVARRRAEETRLGADAGDGDGVRVLDPSFARGAMLVGGTDASSSPPPPPPVVTTATAIAAAAAATGKEQKVLPPVGAGYFVADALEPAQLPMALVDKLAAMCDARHSTQPPPAIAGVTPRAARALIDWMAASLCAEGAPPLSPKCEALKTLPIFECMADAAVADASMTEAALDSEIPPPPPLPGLVSLERQRYLLAEPHPFFTPAGSDFLRTADATPPEVRRLLRGLGVQTSLKWRLPARSAIVLHRPARLPCGLTHHRVQPRPPRSLESRGVIRTRAPPKEPPPSISGLQPVYRAAASALRR